MMMCRRTCERIRTALTALEAGQEMQAAVTLRILVTEAEHDFAEEDRYHNSLAADDRPINAEAA